MSNLIPEKRVDRNGRLVTKHVRSASVSSSQSVVLPAPAAGREAPQKGQSKPYKPRPRQQEQYLHQLPISTFPVDEPLVTKSEMEVFRALGSYTNISANDVEFYDVLSATTSTGNALALMRKGIRTADNARVYLRKHKAPHLIADRSELAQEALRRGIYPHDFVTNYEKLLPHERKSQYALDAVEFMKTSLNDGGNALVKLEILNGNISFSDLKEIGVTKLKGQSRAFGLMDVLTTLNKGEASYSLDDIKELVDRSHQEKLTAIEFSTAADTLYHLGAESLTRINSLSELDMQHYHYLRSHTSDEHRDKTRAHVFQLLTYATLVYQKLTVPVSGKDAYFTDEFYEAGIPVETAVEIINAGGGINQAKAIHDEGIEASLSSGWL